MMCDPQPIAAPTCCVRTPVAACSLLYWCLLLPSCAHSVSIGRSSHTLSDRQWREQVPHEGTPVTARAHVPALARVRSAAAACAVSFTLSAVRATDSQVPLGAAVVLSVNAAAASAAAAIAAVGGRDLDTL